MIRNLLLLLAGVFTLSLTAQQYTISGTVSGLENKDVLLLRITGDNRKVIDTARTDLTGSFEFLLPDQLPAGQYGVITGKGQMVELLFNRENIRFVTTGSAASDQVQIIESAENLLYYDYLGVKGRNLYKLDLLNPVILYYPGEDPFYTAVLNQVDSLRREIHEKVRYITEEYPGSMVSRFIKVDEPVFPDPRLSPSAQNNYLKSHYFRDEDFVDTLLLNSNILTSKIISYLSLYQDQNLNQQQLEAQLIRAVDTVLSKAAVDQTVYEYIIDFLIAGFEAIGFESGLEHLANSELFDDLCVNTERKKKLENKMELIRKLAIGQPAPDFSSPDLSGDTIRLSGIEAEKIVLVFWASWCPHCGEILPVLKEYYNRERTDKLQIIGISVDNDEASLKASIEEHGYNWINIGELKGWDGSIVDEYGIHATPTLIVLDAEKTIIGKPGNESELRSFLQ